MCLLMSLTSSVLPSFLVFISNVTCIFFFSPLSLETAGIISCASMQSCQISPLVLFFGSVYSWDKLSRPPLFFVLNSKHLNGFWRRGSVGGGADKETFSWDAFTSKFLLERVAVIHVDSDSLWDSREGLESTECAVWMHKGRQWKEALVAVCFYRLPSRSRTPENVPLTCHAGSPPSARTLSRDREACNRNIIKTCSDAPRQAVRSRTAISAVLIPGSSRPGVSNSNTHCFKI